MKNIFLILSLVLTITACSDKRESDIDNNFGNNNPGNSLQALPSNQTTNVNIPVNAAVPFVVDSNNSSSPVFSIINQPVHGTVSINSNTGAYVYTPNVNYSGPDLFTWQVQQGSNTAQSSVNITVVPANQPPTANNQTIVTNEDTPVTGTATGTDPNNDPLTFILVSQPSHGTIIFNSNGTFTYTPNVNYFGSDSFTFQVNDGQLNSNISTISLTINSVNDAPVANNSSFTTPEDTPYSGNLIASDVENSSLTYSLISSPLHGNVTINPTTGAYVYTPNANYVGTDSFSFKVSDGSVNSNLATVSITVTPLNDAPIALASSFTTPEDTVYNGLLTGLDPDGNVLTYIIVANPTKGTLVLNNNNLGTYTYIPNANVTGSDSFTFKVNDGQLDSLVVTVGINITPVNDAPVAINSSFAVNAGSSYNGQALATDIDSSVLQYSMLSSPTKGSITFNSNGSFTYTANVNATGSDSFTFKVNDGQLDSNVATITINLNAINQPPIANNLTINTNEDTAVTATVVATDPNSNPLSYVPVTFPTNGSLSFNGATGSFTYTPNPNYFGTDSFTYKANDGQLDSNIATVTINVISVNDVPVAQGNSFIINEDQILTGTLVASDADGNLLTYSIVTSTTNGSVSLTGNSFTYTPNSNYTGADSFTFRVNDGTVNSNIATILITVNPLNDPPVVNNLTLNIPEDTPISSNFIFTDTDGPVVGPWTIVSNPNKGTVNITNTSTGAFTYTPNLNQNGVDTFQVKLSDSLADSNIATITINIAPVNDAPVAFNGSFAINPGQTYNGNLLASDVDGNALTYSIVSSPTKGTVSVNSSTGAFTYSANLNSTGADSFTFRVNDGSLNSNIATISVSLNLINIAPVALSQSFSTLEDTTLSNTLTATDINGDVLTYILVSGPSNGSLSLNINGSFTYTPNANYVGTDSFTFKANDGQLDSNIATINLNVTPVNDAPVALNQTFSVSQTVAFNNQATATDIENSPLTYILISNVTKGSLIFNSNGSFTYTANANATGSDSFTFKVNDGQLDSNVATITFNINGLNQPPVANNLNLTTLEDQPLSATLSATDVNLADILTYAIVTQPSNGSLSLNSSTGSFVFTPNTNFNGIVSFTYKANDGQTDSNIATVTITVTPVNDAPVANNQSVTTPEDVVYNGNLIATDVDSTALIYTVVSNVSNGTLTVNSNGSFNYIPNANFNGSDSFTFRSNDGSLNSNIATVTITVTPVNDAPVANNLSFTTPEATAYSGNLTASDVDGNILNYSLVSSPVKGTITVNSNGTFIYTPGLNQVGSDVFTFKVNDGTLDSNIAIVSITITSGNDAPIANNQSVSTPEDTIKNINLTASDSDGDSLTYTVLTNPSHGTLTGTAPNLIYTPNANFNGTDSFTFRVNDGTVNSNVATVSITVTPVNDAPVANNQSLTTPEDTALNITLTASDIDNNPLTYTVVSGPVNGTLSGTGANRIYTPNPNFTGGDVIIFKANDGQLDSNLGIISINVTSSNDLPLAFNQTIVTPEDTSVNITLLGSDPEGNILTYTVVSLPSQGILSGTGANRVYTPSLNFNGTDSFTFKVNDGTSDSNIATVTINVTPVNDPPVANNQSITVLEDTSFSGNLTASDIDGNTLTYTSMSAPVKGVVTVNANGSFVYTPNLNETGADSFTFRVNDGTVNSNVATVAITITPVNDAPVANNQSLTTPEDTALNITLTASDAESNLLTYTVVSGPVNGTLSGTGANRIYTPNANFNGTDSFTFRVNDGTVNSNVATVSITVTPVNDAPVANNQSIVVLEGTTFNGNLTGFDIDGDNLTYSMVSNPLKGSLVVNNNGSFVYTPGINQTGSDNFTFKVNDGQLNSNVATVSITITSVNDAPVANNQSLTTPEDTALNITLTGTDADGDVLTYTIVSLPSQGILSGTGANRIYTPNANFNGTDSFTFRVNDGTVNSNVATVSITVTPVNDAPVANNSSFTMVEDSVYNGNLSASDIEGNALTYSIVSAPTKGSVSISNVNTGAFTYTPNLNQNGSDSFTFKVNDGQADSNVATVTINITPVNDAPIALSDNISTNEDNPVAVILVGTDPENSPLTYTILTNPTQGTLTGTAPNLIYTPPTNYYGVVSLTYKVNDGLLDSNVATITITVNSVNDIPMANNKSVTTIKNQSVTNNVTASDVENSPLIYSIVSSPIYGTVSLNSTSGIFTYIPNTNYYGPDSFTFKVNDGQADSNVATVSITVTNPNTAPVAISQSYQVLEDTPFVGNMQANDAQGDILTYTVLTQPINGTLSFNASNGSFTYTPNLNFNGLDSFTFKANDGQVDSNIATISLTINSVNDLPVANNQSITVNQNSTNNPITLVGSDVDSTSLSYIIVTNPQYGILSGTGANITYTPNQNYYGPDSFTFKVNDGQADSNVATVSITVKDLGGWCDLNFSYAHKLLLNNQDQNENLTNFPVMIKLNSARVNYANFKSQGADLRFYDSSCNLLAYEIERWNPSGDSYIWVKVPQIQANSNESFIWMQYGNSAANDAQNPQQVWSDKFVGVWHLEETTGLAKDSTNKGGDASSFGSPLRNVGGRIAGADMFDSIDDGLRAYDAPPLRLNWSLTMESWVYINQYSTRAQVLQKHFNNGTRIDYGILVDDGYPVIVIGTKEFKLNERLAKNAWYQLTGTYNKTEQVCKFYINGVLKLTTNKCSYSPVGHSGSENVFKIGNNYPGTNIFNGAIDEVRIEEVDRNHNWIKAQHLSMTDGMVSYGSKRVLGDNWNHSLMTIKDNNDDGKIYVPNSTLHISGHNGLIYQGSSSAQGVWGYYRFKLPATIPNNAQIKKVSLRLYGRDKVNWTNQQLQVSFQNSANAPVVSSANQFPGGSAGVTQIGIQNWGPNLNWLLDDWNDSPNIKNSLINLISAKGTLNSGNYIQIWVTRPIDTNTSTMEVGSEDNAYETINHGQLMIEWE